VTVWSSCAGPVVGIDSGDLRTVTFVSKHGKPVAKLVPIQTETDEIFSFLSGKGTIAGDVVSPAVSLHEWGELK